MSFKISIFQLLEKVESKQFNF